MGRRNRRKDYVDGDDDKNNDDRDYSLERTEKEWLIRSSSKRLKTEIVVNTSTKNDDVDVGNVGVGLATLPSPPKVNKNESTNEATSTS